MSLESERKGKEKCLRTTGQRDADVDEVHQSCQGGVSESPHEDDRVRLVNLEQQGFEERTRGSQDHPVGIEPLSIFTE